GYSYGARAVTGTLHLLGGTGYDAPPGTRVGEVVWRYADGSHARSPIEYAVHLRDWWGLPYEQPPRVTDPHSRCVWRADHPEAARWGKQLRLYLVTLANPRPGRPLRALELATAGHPPTLFVLGLTLDELPPGARGAGFEDLDALRPGLMQLQSVFLLEAGTDHPVAGAEVRASFEEVPLVPGGRGAWYHSTAESGADGHAALPRAAAEVGFVNVRAEAAGFAAAVSPSAAWCWGRATRRWPGPR
ncbi:MAG TPA: hypothetical protein PKE47_13970, partial [Verrucomicrobiota bacterium]|nr:hypothetical protein [Verrucomicrobiota bacterium]